MSNPDDTSLDVLAAGAIDDIDVRTLQQMAQLYQLLDPVPTGLVEQVQFGITLEALHAEVAELQRSSDVAGVRSGEATEAQTVTFTSASLTMMVTITPSGTEYVRIDGWLAPAQVMTVELRAVGTLLSTETDEDGRFVFDEAPRGLAQFVMRPSEDSELRPVVTRSVDL
jgi:hypothetical protein